MNNRMLLLGLLGVLLASQAGAANYTFTTLHFPGAAATYLSDINNSGQVTGRYYSGAPYANDTHGFVKSGGTFIPLDVPGAESTVPMGINDIGQVVGGYVDGLGGHAFIASIAPPVPEPEEWAMMLVGIGLVGFQVRRKQANRLAC